MTQPIQFSPANVNRRDSKSAGSSPADTGPSFRLELTAAMNDVNGNQDSILDKVAIVRRFNENGFFAQIAPTPLPSRGADVIAVTEPEAPASGQVTRDNYADVAFAAEELAQPQTPDAICRERSLPPSTLVPGRSIMPVPTRGSRADGPSLFLKVQMAATRLTQGAPEESAPLAKSHSRPAHTGASSEFQIALFMRDGVAEVVGRLGWLNEVEHARLLAAIDALFCDHGVRAHRIIFNGAGKPPLARAKGN